MFLPNCNDITGKSLPPKTLCLTYDDGPGETVSLGPGPRTIEIADFLSQCNVRATFFISGKHAEQYPHLLPQIERSGHLIGNHTYSHPNIPELKDRGGDVVDQVIRTDGLIRNYIDGGTIFFRAPYFEWSDEVANTLNSNLLATLNHVGPVFMNHDTSDWDFWANDRSPDECAQNFLNAIGQDGCGIVLMHDSTSDNEVIKQKNKTLQLTKILIPKLQSEGYNFKRLDEIPEIMKLVQTPPVCSFRASNDMYITLQDGSVGQIFVNGPQLGPNTNLTIDYLTPGKVALKAPNGFYLNPTNGGGSDVKTNGQKTDARVSFDVIPIGITRLAFRTITGHYLTRESPEGGLLMAHVNWLREWEVFTFVNQTV